MGFPAPTEKQARILWISVTALAIAVLLALIGLLLWGSRWILNQLSPVIMPLAIAGIIAYLLDPAVDFFEKRKVARPRAILLVFFLGVMLVLILLATVVPRLVVETEALIPQLPTYSRVLGRKLQTWMEKPALGIELTILRKFTGKQETNSVPQSADTNTALPQSSPASTNAPPGGNQTNFMQTKEFEKVISWPRM